MKIHTVLVTHNRLELTKQVIESYDATVSLPHTFCVVDNASTDGTQRWLARNFSNIHLLNENRYPGYACNLGWATATDDVTHLHRADNDFIFLPDWLKEVERAFSENERLGQLGLRTDDEELHNHHNVGGNCVIPRTIWDEGLRYLETPWPKIKTPGYTEDSYMSPDVVRMGWQWERVKRPCIQSISVESPEDPYYRKTWADRGIVR